MLDCLKVYVLCNKTGVCKNEIPAITGWLLSAFVYLQSAVTACSLPDSPHVAVYVTVAS